MQLSEIITIFDHEAPPVYQEPYDNSGLAVGEPSMEITGALVCLDVTLTVLNEALAQGLNLIISHHPLIFSPVRQLVGKNNTEKILIQALRNNVAIYSAHTNMDNVPNGVNERICRKLGIAGAQILLPRSKGLFKLVTYVPESHADQVRSALFSAGAGHIGNYDSCSYNVSGNGTFKPLEGADPYVGEIGKLHFEKEIRIETVIPEHVKNQVIKALLDNHPYEEVAYDIYSLDNAWDQVGAGMIGELPEAQTEQDILNKIKQVFNCKVLRHSKLTGKPVKKVAVCGGSGSFLISSAIAAHADLFLTGEIKYHQFFEAEDRLVVADIGHYESEQFTIEIFYDILKKNLPNFAVRFSSMITSPIYYL
jgi:dinuclear metal center YbgI/SA1388 family protein